MSSCGGGGGGATVGAGCVSMTRPAPDSEDNPDEFADETDMASPDSDEMLSLSASGSESSGGSSR